MKFRTTNKELKEGYYYLFSASYCSFYYLFNYKNPVAYTCGVYGWNSDIYELEPNVAISVGYRPTGLAIPQELYRYEELAQDIIFNKNIKDPNKELDHLIKDFTNKLVEYKRGLK